LKQTSAWERPKNRRKGDRIVHLWPEGERKRRGKKAAMFRISGRERETASHLECVGGRGERIDCAKKK